MCPTSPGSGVQKQCPRRSSGWTTRKWRVLVINTRQQEQDVQITKEHELYFFFLICYCLKLTCCFLSWCHFPRGILILWLCLQNKETSNNFVTMRNQNTSVKVRNFSPTRGQNVSVRWTVIKYSLSGNWAESKSLFMFCFQFAGLAPDFLPFTR